MFRLPLAAGFIPLATLTLTASSAFAADAGGLRSYTNARFGYTLQYPSALLVAKKEADNGDGRRFESRDRKVLLRAFGSYNIKKDSVTGKMSRVAADWRADGAQITYQKSGDGWYALSGFVGGDIFYEKALLRNGTFATIIWEYPKSYRQRLDTSVTQTVRSFHFGTVRETAYPAPSRGAATAPQPRAVAMRPIPPKAVAVKPLTTASTKPQNKPKPTVRKEHLATPTPKVTPSRGY